MRSRTLQFTLAAPLLGMCAAAAAQQVTFPYDVVWSQVDDTGIALFPLWKSETAAPPAAPDPSMCGNNDPWTSPCTSQPTSIDNNKGLCPTGKLGGHANWIAATYVGRITWESHSLESQDDDYNFNLLPLIPQSPTPWITASDDASVGLHIEFSSDETIDHFHTPWWSSFHAAVDDDDSRSIDNPFGQPRREMYTGTSKALAMVQGTYAIVTGLLGLDCAHSCGAEIHPVWAMAMHVKDDPNDDTWVFFARNWGNEGYCATNNEAVDTQSFTFRIPWRPGSSDVAIVGQDLRWKDDQGAGGTFDARPDEKAILMTFTLEAPSAGDRMNGEVHLAWKGTPDRSWLAAVPPSHKPTAAELSTVVKQGHPPAGALSTVPPKGGPPASVLSTVPKGHPPAGEVSTVPKPGPPPAAVLSTVVGQRGDHEDEGEELAAQEFLKLSPTQRAAALRNFPKRDTTPDSHVSALRLARVTLPAHSTPPRILAFADARGVARVNQRKSAVAAAKLGQTVH